MTDEAAQKTAAPATGADVTKSSSSSDIRRRMGYLRERLKDLRVERERLMAERDGLKEELDRRDAEAKAAKG
jgi:hypothetical protein